MCSKCKTKVNTTIEMNLYPRRNIPAVGSIHYPLYMYIPSHHTLNPTQKISKLYMSDVGVSIEDAREVARRSERAEALANIMLEPNTTFCRDGVQRFWGEYTTSFSHTHHLSQSLIELLSGWSEAPLDRTIIPEGKLQMLKDARAEVKAAIQSAALARHQSCLCLLGLSDDDANYLVLFFVPPDSCLSVLEYKGSRFIRVSYYGTCEFLRLFASVLKTSEPPITACWFTLNV